MALIVQKYGGTSLATPELVRRVAARVVSVKQKWGQVVTVVSAMGDQTDELLALAKRVSAFPNRRELDMLMTAGERVSMALLSMAIHDLGECALSLTGSQCGIVTDDTHTDAKILAIKGDRIRQGLKADAIVIVAGFQGISLSKEVTTLGRGGSDTTAVALATALGADRCEILTDVDGVFTADPRLVPEARKLDFCTYDEMIELSAAGAKVLHPRAVDLASRFSVCLTVGSSFHEGEGTVIGNREGMMDLESYHIRGITHDSGLVKISLSNIPAEEGVLKELLALFASNGIALRLMLRSAQTGRTQSLTFVLEQVFLSKVVRLLIQTARRFGATEDDIHVWEVASVTLVGEGIASQKEVYGKVLRLLGEAGVQIYHASSTALTIATLIDRNDVELALRTLHNGFELVVPRSPFSKETSPVMQ